MSVMAYVVQGPINNAYIDVQDLKMEELHQDLDEANRVLEERKATAQHQVALAEKAVEDRYRKQLKEAIETADAEAKRANTEISNKNDLLQHQDKELTELRRQKKQLVVSHQSSYEQLRLDAQRQIDQLSKAIEALREDVKRAVEATKSEQRKHSTGLRHCAEQKMKALAELKAEHQEEQAVDKHELERLQKAWAVFLGSFVTPINIVKNKRVLLSLFPSKMSLLARMFRHQHRGSSSEYQGQLLHFGFT